MPRNEVRRNDMRGCTNGVCFLVFMIVFFISIPMVFFPLGAILNLDDEICYIERIEYPTVEPSVNSDNWLECSCGSNCDSFKPCIKIFTNLSDEIYMTQSVYKSASPCTFYTEERCNETIDFTNYLQSSIQTYNEHINKTIDCYQSDDGMIDGIFFENDVKYTVLIIISVVMFIILLVCYCNNYECLSSYFKDEWCYCKFISRNNQRVVTAESVVQEVKIIHNPVFDTVIDIPTVKLSKQEKKEQCVICLEPLKKDVIKLNCDHLIHKKCWEQWNQQNKKTCPICRAEQ